MTFVAALTTLAVEASISVIGAAMMQTALASSAKLMKRIVLTLEFALETVYERKPKGK